MIGKVIRTNKIGAERTMYFEISSGQLVKEIFEKDGMQNIIEYNNYTSFEKLIFPQNIKMSITSPQGTQIVKSNLKEVIIDKGIEDSNFN